MVFLRKSSGGLDLLTEAQVVERFPRLRTDLAALYAGYYIAELLGEWTEDYDPHSTVFDEALETLRALGTAGVPTGPRLLRFETVLLRELGYAPVLETCASCHGPLPVAREMLFSAMAGGMVCGRCRVSGRGRVTLSRGAWEALRRLIGADAWQDLAPGNRLELRQLLNQYITHLLGRPLRTMPYLGS
jgi:DNA repair protein RecO (recombination protein O)